MKYINAETQSSLRDSILEFFNLTKDELELFFWSMKFRANEEVEKQIRDFVESRTSKETFEFIQMFHLSRRLNGSDPSCNENLAKVLLEDSPVSRFLKKYELTFRKGEDHIDMFFKGKLQTLENEDEYGVYGNIYYIRSRLGYNTEQDYCVNGFAFRSYLEKNHYSQALSRGPELLQNIERLLDIDGMVSDYCKNSKYYCIEYLVPLSEVYFDLDYHPPKTDREKTLELLKWSMLRLYNEWLGIISGENLVLRLADDTSVTSEWFVNAEEISI